MSTPPDQTAGFRRWIVANLDYGEPVRAEAVRMAISATMHRMGKFGLESRLNRYRSQDLLQFQAMGEGPLADHLLRIAFTRAVVEDQRAIIEAIRRYDVAPEQVAWFDRLDGSDAAAAVAAAGMAFADVEERAVTRLILARRHPTLIEPAWWWEVPAGQPLIAFQLLRTALGHRPEYAPIIHLFLQERRDVLLADEPDDLLAALVRAEKANPQSVLATFEGVYDEGTVVAAAEWHLERGQPIPALELTRRVRWLSRHYARAMLISGLALIELGRLDEAAVVAASIEDTAHADRFRIRLAQAVPALVQLTEVAAIGSRCPAGQPELFFTVLQILLGRGQLGLARDLCHERGAAFAGTPSVAEAVRAILGQGG